ncbi:MAG TPA: prolyl oligopeptidase family serine peptidase [Vicinamibacterales bacterium]|nr:prolyl oligopeptidase family serine peptidase [Vicinamibacterales bacterium]
MNIRSPRLVFLAIGLSIAVSSLFAQEPAARRAFTPGDWYRVKTLSNSVMSPDGKYVAVQVTNVIEAKNTRVNEIWVASTAPGAGEPQRFSAPGFDSTNPSFSADSTTLIFTSTRPGYSGNRWAVRMDRAGGEFQYTGAGGATGAADAGGGDFAGRGGGAGPAAAAATSPKDGSFTISTGVPGAPAAPGNAGRGNAGGGGGRNGGGGGPRGGGPAAEGTASSIPGRGTGAPDPYSGMPPMAKPPMNAITLPLDPARFDGMQIIDARYKANGRGFVPSTGGGPIATATAAANGATPGAGRGAGGGGRGGNVPAGDGPPTQVLIDRKDGAGPKPVTTTLYSHRNATVSPDGKWIVFAADAELRPDTAVKTVRDQIAALGTDAERTAATRDRLQTELFVMAVAGGTPKRIRAAGNESGVEWSADSRWITFTANNGPNTTTNIYLADVTTGSSRSLTGDLRTDGGPVDWLASGDLLMQLTVGGRNALYRINPRTGDRKEIVGGRRRISGFTYDTARTKVAYIASAQETPTELFLSDLDGTERQVSHFNKDVNAAIAWSPSERFTFKSVGDQEIECWLVKPYGYEAGKKYPLVLYIHGGPHSAYNEGWFDEFQNLAGAGMWVLYTNPRGSSGYGAEFQDMIRARWGEDDYLDLMKAVDVAAARPDVDPDRLGVTGGSYGGFMTAWITTKTTRFKAAETDRMISNWLSWYGASDAQSLTEGEFLGTPWKAWDMYVDKSPLKYADKVKTPTLLIQSEEDYRAPIVDAEQWFMALQKNGVPAEFIRYPRSNHDLSRTGEPWLLTDRLNRIRQWFSYWLKDERPGRLK